MKGRPARMTQQQHDVLLRQSQLRKRLQSYKQLAAQTGFSKTYCQQVVQRMMNGVQITVSRGALAQKARAEEIDRAGAEHRTPIKISNMPGENRPESKS